MTTAVAVVASVASVLGCGSQGTASIRGLHTLDAVVRVADVGAPSIGALSLPVPGDATVVAPWGSDSNSGTSSDPLRTLGHAVVVAPWGGTIVMRGGSYHEDVTTPYGKRLTIQPWPWESVWLDGSQATSGWVSSGSAWRLDGWDVDYDNRDTTGVMVTPAYPAAAYSAELFVDGVSQRQVLSRSAVVPGTFYVDEPGHRVYLGSSPYGHSVRISDLQDALFVNGGAGSAIIGIGFRRYATPVVRIGTVKMYADGARVEDCVFQDNALAGLSLNGSGITVSNSTFARNGQLGLQANQSDDLTTQSLEISDNNTEHFATNQAAGGMKVTASRRVTVKDNRIERNSGVGLWLDQSVLHAVVVRNRLLSNVRDGCLFEISADLAFVDNIASGNGVSGLRVLEAGHVRAWYNTLTGNIRAIDMMDGGRRASQAGAAGLDPRYGTADASLTWEVTDVDLRGNVEGDGPSGAQYVLGYDDARKTYGAQSRRITSDRNGFFHTSGSPRWLVAWGSYPSGMRVFTSLSAFRSYSGQDWHSTEVWAGTDPWSWLRNTPAGLASVPQGPALPTDLAGWAGLVAGRTYPIGAQL